MFGHVGYIVAVTVSSDEFHISVVFPEHHVVFKLVLGLKKLSSEPQTGYAFSQCKKNNPSQDYSHPRDRTSASFEALHVTQNQDN